MSEASSKQTLTQEVWVGPEVLHFSQAPSAETARSKGYALSSKDIESKFKWCPSKSEALRSIPLPSSAVDSDANCENQSQGQEGCQDDQPLWWEWRKRHPWRWEIHFVKINMHSIKVTWPKQEPQSAQQINSTKGPSQSADNTRREILL